MMRPFGCNLESYIGTCDETMKPQAETLPSSKIKSVYLIGVVVQDFHSHVDSGTISRNIDVYPVPEMALTELVTAVTTVNAAINARFAEVEIIVFTNAAVIMDIGRYDTCIAIVAKHA